MDEENTPTSQPEAESSGKPKMPLIPLAAAFLATFILAGVGNYLHLKSTWIPPVTVQEPPVEEPLLTVDFGLGGDPDYAHDAVEVAPAPDSLPHEVPPAADTATVLRDAPPAALGLQDSLPAEPPLQLTEQPVENAAEAPPDSAQVKRAAKLAKIIENMEPEDAAKMLEGLDDDMVIYILLRLKQRQAAQIMAQLPPSRACDLGKSIMEPVVQR